VKKVDVALG